MKKLATDWRATIRANLERALLESGAEQLEELSGLLVTFGLRIERELRARASVASEAVQEGPLSSKEVAARLGVPAGAVREWARSGKIPCEHYGRFVRFQFDAVRAALAEMEQKRMGERARR